MKRMKRVVSFVLCMLMLFNLVGVSAWVTEADAATNNLLHSEMTYINPLYADQVSEDDLIHSEHQHQSAAPRAAEEETYYNAMYAGEQIRAGLTRRQQEISVNAYCEYGSENTLNDDLSNLVQEVVAWAMVHTGEPTEGDYLLWQYAGWEAELTGGYDETYAYVTIYYTFTYYTDAAQEAELDAAIADLLDTLDVGDSDNYGKLKAVYDYICANVTYDYENLENDAYTLKHTAYAAMMNGTAVCQGYALLLYRLSLELGIDCRLIAGDGGGPHGWNIAEIDGLYYNLDSTWDAGRSEYKYFLVCPDNFTDHIRYEEYDTQAFHEVYPMAGEDYCDHSYTGVVTTEPGCTEAGVMTYTCDSCGEQYTEAIAATGHSYDEGAVTTEPGCTEDGVMTYTCDSCGEQYTEAIEATGHSYNDGTVITEATCTESGVMAYICTVCGVEFTEEIPVIPHNYVDGFCSVCGAAQMTVPEILSCYSKLQDSVKVTWTLSEGADGYELWRTTTPDDDDSWVRTKTIKDGATDRYTNQDLEIGTTYYYKVRAYANGADGSVAYTEFSNVDYMPAAVVFDGPYSNATFRIRLRWNEVDGAHGYQIWRMNEDGSYSIVKTLGDRGNELTDNQGATTAYSNTGLTAGETYTYKMRAFMITEDGRKVFGAYSDEMTIGVMPETPVLTVSSPKATRAQLTWDAVNGAAGYQVWMAESENGEYKIAKSITDGSTTYTKYDLTSGKTYYFKIRAYVEVEGKKTFGAYSEIEGIKVQ